VNGKEVCTLQGSSAATVKDFNEGTKEMASVFNKKFDLDDVKLGYLLKNMDAFCALWKIKHTIRGCLSKMSKS
jgi:hypothetical protein